MTFQLFTFTVTVSKDKKHWHTTEVNPNSLQEQLTDRKATLPYGG
ncbi:hypothetical protein ACFFGV_01110 [Pontibacillus salicampi]|uniref:YrzI family small protein n=1 Tax=Pontibacillus salicampi TaxID=1449801 RepID=A0ABV6LIG7_9BACI